MKIVTVSGPPSSGKTAIISHIITNLAAKNIKTGVVKFDCLTTDDGDVYRKANVPVLVGLSGNVCPDHYFSSNIIEGVAWAEENLLDLLIVESAGLCNRCAPHLENTGALCVIDNLMGMNTPKKVGPMLKKSDIVAITKGDIVSQAEREVFAFHVQQANPRAQVLHVNGITGQGCAELVRMLSELSLDAETMKLRFSMPAAVCSYCLGERNIREEYSLSTLREMRYDRE